VLKRSGIFKDEQKRTALIALLPSAIIFTAFTLYPLAYSLVQSFTDASLLRSGQSFIGFDNYVKLLKDESFRRAMLNTLVYTLGVVPVSNILSFLLALALNRRLRLTSLFRTAFFLPVVASTASVATIWFLFYDPYYGGFNNLLAKIGILGPAWLSDPKWALFAVIIMSIWKNLGYSMVIYLAGLQDVPQDLYDAAALDGAGHFQKTRFITLPLMSRIITFTMIMSTIRSFQVFGQIRIMTGGGPTDSTLVAVYYLYRQAFESPYRFGYASAAAWLIFLILGSLAALQASLARRLES
jgi:multiple sugar transport system permease protein